MGREGGPAPQHALTTNRVLVLVLFTAREYNATGDRDDPAPASCITWVMLDVTEGRAEVIGLAGGRRPTGGQRAVVVTRQDKDITN
jgi:hypothetical protein